MSEPLLEGKSHHIPKRLVWDAWVKVKRNGGAAGVDGVTIEQFGDAERLKDNLFKLWNRMSSGSYFPGPVRAVKIPKKGGTRVLGIPNVVDRVAQTVAVLALEPEVEQVFHPDSYGYRPGRSPLDAIKVCRKRCWEKDWVVDLDVSKFFDSVRWDLALKAVERHTDQKWILLYVERWLKASMRIPDGSLIERTQGTPQGGPISPLLANLFLHYGMDIWLSKEYPGCHFERFADDAVIHCATERQALEVKDALGARFADIGLLLHPDKTKIVYCKDGRRRRDYPVTSFTFCGYEFRPRKAFDARKREAFTGFMPAPSPEKITEMGRKVSSWLGLDVVGDRDAALLAGEVGLMDQCAQRVGDLGRPVRVGVDLAGTSKITKKVLTAQLVGKHAEFGRIVVLVAVVHDHCVGEVFEEKTNALTVFRSRSPTRSLPQPQRPSGNRSR